MKAIKHLNLFVLTQDESNLYTIDVREKPAADLQHLIERGFAQIPGVPDSFVGLLLVQIWLNLGHGPTQT